MTLAIAPQVRRPTHCPAMKVRRWTRQEYFQAAALGWFRGQRVMLLEGRVWVMAPQGHLHALSVARVRRAVTAAFGSQHWIREEKPLLLGQHSDPEPDIAVCEFDETHYSDHPTTALLVVEVSDTSLAVDRRKAGIYAKAGIPEYWLVNLESRQLEVHRLPQKDSTRRSGYRYGDIRVLAENQVISPLARPRHRIAIAKLLP